MKGPLSTKEGTELVRKFAGSPLESSVVAAVARPGADAIKALRAAVQPYVDEPRRMDAAGRENDFIAEDVRAIREITEGR